MMITNATRTCLAQFKLLSPAISALKVKPFCRHQTTYTDSDYYEKTTLTPLTMDEGYNLQITGLNQYGFQINHRIDVFGSILIFPKTIFSWNVSETNGITEKSLNLFKLMEPKLGQILLCFLYSF